MKTVELSDETYQALQSLAASRNLTLDALLAKLAEEARSAGGDGLLLFLGGEEFSALTDSAERYLALLGWCARNHGSDFADFISHQ